MPTEHEQVRRTSCTVSFVCSPCIAIDIVLQVLVEEQLRDGREWLFDTESPGLADISVHFLLAWVGKFPGVKNLYDTAPTTCQVRVGCMTHKSRSQQENI